MSGIWMPEILTSVLDAGRLTPSALDWLVAEGISENDQIDYKSAVSPKTDPDRDVKFAIDVAAFANHRGGLLLYGVKENAGLPVALPGLGTLNLDSTELMMRAWIGQRVTPAPIVQFDRVSANDGEICMAVSVPPSTAAPHGVLMQKSPTATLRWPERDGASTRYLSGG